MRLDLAVVDQGLARSRNRAARLILDGKVVVNGCAVTKPSTVVSSSDLIEISASENSHEWASRASFKLARTLEALSSEQISITGKLCLDIGASTGGFTDVLLRNGATRVVALDVGHDQLVPELRADQRVVVIEGYNARNLSLADLPYTPEVVVCDVSFISLSLLLPAIARCVAPSTDLLLMVKPQFEVGRDRLGSGGIVRDPALHVEAVQRIALAALEVGLSARAVIPSALPGPHGNREFFLWLSPSSEPSQDLHGVAEHEEHLLKSVRNAVEKSAGVSVDGDMIVGQAQLSVRGGIPDSQLVPSTQVFWV